MVPVDHRSGAGRAEPLEPELAFDKLIAAASAVARVAVEVRPFARARKRPATDNIGILWPQESDSAVGTQHALDLGSRSRQRLSRCQRFTNHDVKDHVAIEQLFEPTVVDGNPAGQTRGMQPAA